MLSERARPVQTPAECYDRFLERATASDNVVGVVLTGSRAAGAFVTAGSDYDAYVVLQESEPGWETPRGAMVEIWPMVIRDFRRHALAGSGTEWDRASLLYARVDLDKLHGEVGRIVDRKRRLTPREARRVARGALDTYIYALARSLRNQEAGRHLEGRLEAMETLPPLLTAAFALEGRVRPFHKWLRHELARRPLLIGDLADRVERIAVHAAPSDQRQLFRAVEELARAAGHAAVVDAWQPDLAWLRGSSAPTCDTDSRARPERGDSAPRRGETIDRRGEAGGAA